MGRKVGNLENIYKTTFYNLGLNIYLTGKKPIARQEPIPRIFYSWVLSLLDWPEGGDCEVDWRGEIVDLEREHEDDVVRIYQPLHQLWSRSGTGWGWWRSRGSDLPSFVHWVWIVFLTSFLVFILELFCIFINQLGILINYNSQRSNEDKHSWKCFLN